MENKAQHTNTFIKIQPFAEWMNPQVINMFAEFYDKNQTQLLNEHNKFYNHYFQESKVIRIVALVGEMVIGFTSFAYWPYKKGNALYNSYQVGNAMIHPDYRGKGIFHKLLQYFDDNHQLLGVDFLVAFPHDSASYPSFMRFGYINPFDLNWAIKLFNPMAWIKTEKAVLSYFDTRPNLEGDINTDCFRLYREEGFNSWFFGSRIDHNYAYYNHQQGDSKVTFYLRSTRRGRWINELTIGDIRMDQEDEISLKNAFKKFFQIVKKSGAVTIISIAYSPSFKSHKNDIIKSEFNKIKPVIHFVYRNYLNGTDLSKPEDWELYRSDLDTW